MSTAATWSSEYEQSGRVVFPQRRSRLLIRLAIGLVLFASSLWSNIQHLRAGDVSGALGILRITALVGFISLVAVAVWQLVTRRPAVTVDTTGITLGRRTHLAWPQIRRIDDPSGLPGLRTVQIHPIKRFDDSLGIPQDNVQNLTELTTWLRTLHEDRRTG